ncbi:DUF2381 family protein [Corallococcus macrosporus]|uniref:DUF2381 family protein n=1 Tax=Corallococcus macrosporus DSM 14697 TaxID=1189310 RepID=A0A250JRA6_9BACT|nr:DUF2381 family protein [Corallococcus macrosporus]ATB46365.1 hypothetical protein MYMAC_001957 [Corallococcus macrosporus DSM 14697]
MQHPVSTVLLFFLLLGEGTARAQQAPSPAGMGVRRVELAPEDAQVVAEVAVSPGLSTVFIFDSEVSREGVELQGRNRFTVLDAGQSTLRLVPSERISAGDRLRLTVRFLDGAAPATATFVLIAHPARPEALVEVYRRKRGVETYQEEARQARAEAQQCKEENERLRGERNAPGGLTGLISTAVLDKRGVDFRDLSPTVAQSPGVLPVARSVYTYRSSQRVAVVVEFDAAGAAQPWTANGATLRGKANEELKVLQVWQSGPVSPELRGLRVVVEAEAASDAPRGSFTLKLWEADGPRTVTLGNVTFP